MKNNGKQKSTGQQFEQRAAEEMHGKAIAAYQMFPLMDDNYREEHTNIAIPSDDEVEQAKKWVDENKK